MTLRRSTIFFSFTGLLMALLATAAMHASIMARTMGPQVQMRAAMVRELGLSDLCLFTEARYSRHLSVTDRNSAFQDHPLSFEHFPSGSLVGPPQHIKTGAWTHGTP